MPRISSKNWDMKANKAKGPTEYQIQKTAVQWFRCKYPKFDKCLIAIPNGTKLHGDAKARAMQGAKLKNEGVVPGASDLFLAVPRHGYHGKWIEVKADKGKVQRNQLEFIDAMLAQGYCAEVVFGLDALKDSIQTYMAESPVKKS